MADNKCLSCKWEPDWGPVIGIQWARRIGSCKHPIIEEAPSTLPAAFKYHVESIVRYADDSGMPSNCNAWEAKCVLRRIRRTR